MEESFKTTPPAAGQARPGILARSKPDDPRRGGPDEGEGVDSAPDAGQPSAVRFNSAVQEIEPRESLVAMTTSTTEAEQASQPVDAETQQALRMVSQSLQRQRTNNFAFEPVSLPASRVPSNETGSRANSRAQSPSLRPLSASMQSPPLTPIENQLRDARMDRPRLQPEMLAMTPQISPAGGKQAVPDRTLGARECRDDSRPPTAPSSRPSTPSVQMSSRPTSTSAGSNEAGITHGHRAKFTVGPSSSAESGPPSPRAGSVAQENYTGSSTSFARSSLLQGEKDDPYARSKRPPQSKSRDKIDPRFVFSAKDPKRGYAQTHHSKSETALPRSGSIGAELKAHSDKRHSFVWKKDHHHHHRESRGLDEGGHTGGSKHGSMADLKRFFGFSHKSKRSQSPTASARSSRSGIKTSTSHQPSQPTVPFADDHGLTTKYGKFGKVLGSGAGGSVRLMRRSTDGVTFAVKEFRPRHSYESEKEYAKKVTAEFCVGSTLHHGNIIETLDIVHEKGKWYEVMEYAPFDLFAVVMTGKMSREEVTCTFLQIFAGVTYLHSLGLAHRDLKLDNVVINEHGIMKIIDFGSATVFRYPFENDIVLAQGVVGSDPYLAPEVYDNNKYDPQPADVWSLAVIFCCMSLRRFPWKLPRMTDNSFKLFAAPPSPSDSAMEHLARQEGVGQHPPRPKSMGDLSAMQAGADSDPATPSALSPPTSHPASREPSGGSNPVEASAHGHQHPNADSSVSPSTHLAVTPATGPSTGQATPTPSTLAPGTTTTTTTTTQAHAVVKGPWRLLRLLPRESRHIIGRMLELNPKHRATIEEMLAEPWIANSPVCRQEDVDNDDCGGGGSVVGAPVPGGTRKIRIVRAPGHTHTLEPGTAVDTVPSKASRV